MKVLKFGGTSVANPENIAMVCKIVAQAQQDHPVTVVVSAFSGVTDHLLDAAALASRSEKTYRNLLESLEKTHLNAVQELIPPQEQSKVNSFIKKEFNTLETLLEGAFLIGETTPKLLDKIVGYGELLSSYIIAAYFKAEGLHAERKDGRELIITNDQFQRAQVDFEHTKQRCLNYFSLKEERVTVVPGFVAATLQGDSTTLGRGGSDYTAAIIAAMADASALEIWTDVSGMYTANPKIVKQAFAIPHISYEEAMELSHFGAKVLYPPTVQPVLTKEIPLVIKNTFAPGDPGTLLTKNSNGNKRPVRGISHIEGISLLSLEGSGMVGIPGISKRFFEVLSDHKISAVLITQASSEHSLCIGISTQDAEKARKAIDEAFAYEITLKRIRPVTVENDLAIVALVGDNMKSHQGLSGRMFSTLGKNNVNIRAIAQGASERNISAVVTRGDVKKALNSLHEAFFEENVKQLNLFVMGVGNVGKIFLQQLEQQKSYLKSELKLQVRVIGLANSRKMVFDEGGISLKKWADTLEEGQPAHLDQFREKVISMNLRNSIFVDNTANSTVANTYENYLGRSIAVVTCNKIAASGKAEKYELLKELSKKYNAPYLFETNVGAGLPILDTLKNLVASGDKVREIHAVLSGSLNFIFNNYDTSNSFFEVVQQAMNEGYTEPDPSIDLSGVDVMRKILILARESGYKMELEDIKNDSFLPEACTKASSVSDFLSCLKANESHFVALFQKASQKGNRLKYVASFSNGNAKVGLQEIPPDHPFYNLEGKDNIVLFFTDRYREQPLLIKGAGAGAEVTASGIFADIIRIGR